MRVRRRSASNQDVAQPLVIALDVVMRDVVRERTAEMALTDQDDPVQALSLDRSHEAFRVRVGIRRADGRLHDGNPGVGEAFADAAAPFAITITDELRRGVPWALVVPRSR